MKRIETPVYRMRSNKKGGNAAVKVRAFDTIDTIADGRVSAFFCKCPAFKGFIVYMDIK